MMDRINWWNTSPDVVTFFAAPLRIRRELLDHQHDHDAAGHDCWIFSDYSRHDSDRIDQIVVDEDLIRDEHPNYDLSFLDECFVCSSPPRLVVVMPHDHHLAVACYQFGWNGFSNLKVALPVG